VASVACLLLLDLNTAWLLHAGDPVPVLAGLAPPRRCLPGLGWPRSQSCCCLWLASPPSGGVAGPGSAGSVVPPGLGDRQAPGFFGNQACPPISSTRACPGLCCPPPHAFGREGGRTPRSRPEALPLPSGLLLREQPVGSSATTSSQVLLPVPANLLRKARWASRWSWNILQVLLPVPASLPRKARWTSRRSWKTLHPGHFRFLRKPGLVQVDVAQVQQ
jgi:hypothetical protein